MSKPGLMYIISHPIDPEKTPDDKYNLFYNEEHLPDVLAGGPIDVALRYKNVNPEAKAQYIALYPLDNADYMGSAENLRLLEDTRKSRTLGCDDIADLIHFELRPYTKIQTYEGPPHEGAAAAVGPEPRARTLVSISFEPREGGDQEFDDWMRQEHLELSAAMQGFRRTTRYVRKDGAMPRYLVLNEFDGNLADIPAEQSARVMSTEWARKIMGEARAIERDVYTLIQEQGDPSVKL